MSRKDEPVVLDAGGATLVYNPISKLIDRAKDRAGRVEMLPACGAVIEKLCEEIDELRAEMRARGERD